MRLSVGVARKRSHPAVRFLWIVAGLTVLFMAGALLYRVFETDLMRLAMVPRAAFQPVPLPAGASYRDADMWIARPDIPDNPASWTPAGYSATRDPKVSVFFIHPTSFMERSAWNAPIDDRESQDRARRFVRGEASVFNGIGAIWAPKYRQATFGAFLTSEPDARRALDFAYSDVLAAYEEFLREAPPDRPIILAAHSQGSAHLLRLLAERIRGAPEARRIVAAYVVGWPVSETADMPALALPACQRPDQAGCILSWQSFAEPADPSQVTDLYDASRGPAGPRAGSAMLCVNPLTGRRGGAASMNADLGTLVPDEDPGGGTLRARAVSARCDLRGFLLIGTVASLPAMGNEVLPGNNYHVYDYALFWANIRADAARRLAAWRAR
jgi:hypothetical protein